MMKFFLIWREGLNILVGWIAFSIVVGILYLPAAWFVGTIGEKLGYVIGIMAFVIFIPLVFYLCSKYLNIMKADVVLPLDCPHCANEINVSDLKKNKKQ